MKQMYGITTEQTWLEFANKIAQDDPNEKYDWTAKEATEDGVYLIGFVDKRGWGHRWEVTLEEKVVKYININDYLARKYGLKRVSGSEEFKIESIETDTLRIYKRYRNSVPKIIYQFKGTVINNTDKTIIDADIKGVLNLIFKEKTVRGKSRHYHGFKPEVTKHRPWRPGEQRKFTLKTRGIETIYLDYTPPYILFEIGLEAKDPVGYQYDENITEYDLIEDWKKLSEAYKKK